ncbi:MAG: DUF3127 domain-containing protein [Myxococcota bacterium]
MNMQIQGKIHAAFEAAQVTQRFRKREFVLELDGASRYPQYVQFQLTGDRCEALDGFEKGQEVKVEFSLRGREWTSPKGEIRYFNSLEVWSVENAGAGGGQDGGSDDGWGGPSGGSSGSGGSGGSGGLGDEPPPPSDSDDIPF